jgi:hypothetical protein
MSTRIAPAHLCDLFHITWEDIDRAEPGRVRPAGLDATCPYCGEPPGAVCLDHWGLPLYRYDSHTARARTEG